MINEATKSITLFRENMKKNSLFISKAKAVGLRCFPADKGFALVDMQLPKTCNQYTGITVSANEIPALSDYELTSLFPEIEAYVKSGRNKSLRRHLKAQDESRLYIQSLIEPI